MTKRRQWLAESQQPIRAVFSRVLPLLSKEDTQHAGEWRTFTYGAFACFVPWYWYGCSLRWNDTPMPSVGGAQ